jgi:iron complex transport system ATP-binding protein
LDKSATILTTTNLAIGYKKGQIHNILLKNCDLTIEKGKFICLLGANGVGKSTLIRTLAGLQPKMEGEVYLHGKEIATFPPKELARHMSLVLTDPIQGGNLSVLELVQMGRYPHTNWSGKLSEKDHQKVDSAMEQCGIHYLSDENIFEISDGQLQKALIARALAQDGELMLLDEPTVHLDANNRFIVMQLLKKLVKETGKSILISTHQVEMALAMADELWLANCGEPLMSGTPQELTEKNIIKRMFPYLSQI